MKTIAVIGANGQSGQVFVKAALRHGFQVRAGVHSSSDDLPRHKSLKIIQADATNKDDMHTLLNGADIVVSLIGHISGSPPRVQTDAMTVITQVMKELDIARIISLTGTGVRLPGDTPSLIDKLLNTPLKFIDPDRINDGIEHVKVLQNSDLDWTILRVLKLTNGRIRPYTLSKHGPGKLFVSRSEVADAMLAIIKTGAYSQQAPVVSQ